jgi:hypothetical protein
MMTKRFMVALTAKPEASKLVRYLRRHRIRMIAQHRPGGRRLETAYLAAKLLITPNRDLRYGK